MNPWTRGAFATHWKSPCLTPACGHSVKWTSRCRLILRSTRARFPAFSRATWLLYPIQAVVLATWETGWYWSRHECAQFLAVKPMRNLEAHHDEHPDSPHRLR